MFGEIKRDFGLWVMGSSCALVHWTTAEYDSPAEDVVTQNQQIELRSVTDRLTDWFSLFLTVWLTDWSTLIDSPIHLLPIADWLTNSDWMILLDIYTA